MKKIVLASLTCINLGLGNTPANAMLSDVRLNGFISTAMAWSNVDYLPSGVEPAYISYIQRRPSFDKDSDVGVQIAKPLREDLSMTVQFLALASDAYNVTAKWAFLKYEPNDNWEFRVGRVRSNPFIFSDSINIAYAYPWVRPPQEVYSLIPSSYSTLTGADAKFKYVVFGNDLVLTGFYGAGTSHLDFATNRNSTLFDDVLLRFRDLYSFNMNYGNEAFSIHAGYETTYATLYPNSGTFMTQVNQFINTLVGRNIIGQEYINYFSAYHAQSDFMGLGYQFNWNNIVSIGEIVKRTTDTPIAANAIGWYLMGGYRVHQLLPHVTFARERVLDNYMRRFSGIVNQLAITPPPVGAGFPVNLDTIAQTLVGTSQTHDRGAGSQSSLTLGLRWDIFDSVAIKFETQHVHPDKGSPGLFDVDPLKSVNIYSVAIDAVM